MSTIQVHSRVGEDGVLTLRVLLGPADENTEVTITIQPAQSNGGAAPDSRAHRLDDETYGSCAGLGLEEPADLPLQDRDWMR